MSVLITSNVLARGIDVPECELVINYDVPIIRRGSRIFGDPETYLHRIGRTGRFGTKGIALTLLDRPEDKVDFDGIVDYYNI